MATQVLKFMVNADNRKAIQGFNNLKTNALSAASGIGAAFGLGLGAAGLISFGKNIIEVGDTFDKMSKRFGVGTDFLQEFKYMADLTDTSVEDLGKALKRQAKTLIDADRGLETYQRVFRELNLDYRKLIEMKPEDAFRRISEKLSQLDSDTRRAALAQDIFGRAGTNIIPLLKEYESLKAEAAENVVFSKADIAAAAEFKDEMARINATLMGVATESGFVQWIADVTNRLREAIDLVKRAPKEGERGTGKTAIGADLLRGYLNLPGVKYNVATGVPAAIGRKILGPGSGLEMGAMSGDEAAIEAGRAAAAEIRAMRTPSDIMVEELVSEVKEFRIEFKGRLGGHSG